MLGLVQGGGDAGAALCGADVDLVVFTGSVATGRRVAHACAERLVPCSLELGGKDAAIVLADANLERAANGVVWGAMMNAGQNCASIERVYVEKAIAEEFTEKVRDVVAKLRPGVDVGPLATAAQRALVARHVAEAKAAGATIVRGGAEAEADDGDGKPTREYAPTVVRVADDDTALMRDETFGPVLPIAVVDDVDEAVRRANASRYGLTASLWTKDRKRALLLARKLRAGVVTINNHGFTGALPDAPWCGARRDRLGDHRVSPRARRAHATAPRAGRPEPGGQRAVVVPVHPGAPDRRHGDGDAPELDAGGRHAPPGAVPAGGRDAREGARRLTEPLPPVRYAPVFFQASRSLMRESNA